MFTANEAQAMKAPLWARMPERGSQWGIRVVLFLLNTVGYSIAKLTLLPIVGYFFLTGRAARGASLAYLQRLHQVHPEGAGPPSLWNSYLHHLHFALTLLDRLWLWQGKLEKFHFEEHGRHHLQRSDGKGMLLLGAHLGSFDALRTFSLAEGLKIHIVMHRGHAQKINAVLNTLHPHTNLRVLELTPGDMDMIFALKDCVERGEMIAMVGDRIPPHVKQRVTWLPFLGENAPFPQHPWLLASLLECPVYLTIGLRIGYRQYAVFAEPLAERVELPHPEREARLQNYIMRYALRLEELCCAYPYQWFNFYDFWGLPD
jgi:predicted LPLAT superfamily acyltransferase